MLQSWLYARCWIILLAVAGLLFVAVPMRSQSNDSNAGSDVVGLVMPTTPPGFVGNIPAADREVIKANFERFWGIALRDPALNPPKGFDLKPELTANGILPAPVIRSSTELGAIYTGTDSCPARATLHLSAVCKGLTSRCTHST